MATGWEGHHPRKTSEVAVSDTPSRGPDGTFIETLDTAHRDAEAARLRSRGMGYRAIAEQLGFFDGSGAHKAVQRALAAVRAEGAEEARQLQLQQLDYLATKALEVLERHHVTVSNGRLINVDGEPLEDDGPVLAAIDRLLKIQERRAKLLGLDAPARHEVVTLDAIDAEIARLSAELAGGTEASAAAETAGTAGRG